jgi:hypothetical protein
MSLLNSTMKSLRPVFQSIVEVLSFPGVRPKSKSFGVSPYSEVGREAHCVSAEDFVIGFRAGRTSKKPTASILLARIGQTMFSHPSYQFFFENQLAPKHAYKCNVSEMSSTCGLVF